MKASSLLATTGLMTLVGLGLFAGGNTAHAEEVNYTVKSGDTLSGISQKYFNGGDAISYIAGENNISDINLIHVGQTLIFDTDGVTSNTVSYDATPTVESYDDTSETYSEPVSDYSQSDTSYTGSSSSAKEWIAQKESGGSYSATNGQYIGRYQLTDSYLNGDYSEANQERVADQYVADRYGSWEAAQQFWMNNGWY